MILLSGRFRIRRLWSGFGEKQSPEFISRLDRFMMELEDGLMNFQDVEIPGIS